jgi:hypothetical protein
MEIIGGVLEVVNEIWECLLYRNEEEGKASVVIVSNKARKKPSNREANIKMASHTMRSNELDKSLRCAERNGKGVTRTKKKVTANS